MPTELPENRIKKIKLPNNTEYTIVPEQLQSNGYQASLPTLTGDTDIVVTKKDQTILANKTFGNSSTAANCKIQNGAFVLGGVAGSISSTTSKLSFQDNNGTEFHSIKANQSGVVFSAAGNNFGFYNYGFTPTASNTLDLGRDATSGRAGRWNNIHMAGSIVKYNNTTAYTQTLQNKSGIIALKSDIPSTYLVSASSSGNTLTLTKQDNTTVTYTPSFTYTNQKVKVDDVTFGNDDEINITGSGIVSVTGNDTSDTITISASHQSIKTLNTTATDAQSPNASEAITGSETINLHKVSKTGTYSDLNGKPTLGTAAAKNYTTSVTQNSNDLITSGAVFAAIDNLPEPMIFKGTLGTGGTITSLPTAAAGNEGYTYKVITAGTYATIAAKVGDVFVSCKTGTSTYEWVLIPAGDTDSDTWRQINVNGTLLLEPSISTGVVNFKDGNNVTITGSGNDITIDATDTTYELVNTGTSSDGIKFLEDISYTSASSSGSNTVSKSTHTHTVTAKGSVSLSSSTTSTDGPTYVESISGGSAVSPTTKYMKFNAGTTPKSGATPNHTSTTSGANSGTKVTAVTGIPNFSGGSGSFTPTTKYLSASFNGSEVTSGGNSGTNINAVTSYPNFSGGSLGGTKTFVTGITAGSGSLTSGDTQGTGDIAYIASASHTPASLGTASTGTVSINGGSGSFTGTRTTSGTGSSYRRILTLSHSHTGASLSGTTTFVTGYPNFDGGSATHTTKYLHHTHTSASSSGTGTVTLTPASLGTPNTSSVAPGSHTHSVTAGGSVSLTANSTTGTGRITYIESATHTHTGASLGTLSTEDVSPNAHTHTYDKTTSVSLTAGTAPSMNFNTETSTDTPYISAISGGSAVSATTRYMKSTFTGSSATTSDGSNQTASAVSGITSGSVTKTTKYMKLEEEN